jgi:hypothetical protein
MEKPEEIDCVAEIEENQKPLDVLYLCKVGKFLNSINFEVLALKLMFGLKNVITTKNLKTAH